MKQKHIQLHTKNSSLTCAVLDRIEEENLQPVPAWRFFCLRCMVWLAWVCSIFFGALSFSVLVFVINHTRFALYEATHQSVFSFFIEVAPYVWIFVFILMIIASYYNIRHTKKGYKYTLWKLIGSSIVLSIGAGLLFYYIGVGYVIDTRLASIMPMYQSMEGTERKLWQQPKEGRLLGTFLGMDEQDEFYMFEDSTHTTWSIETMELRDKDKALLRSGAMLRVLGTTTDSTTKTFHACGVFPWMYDQNVSVTDMKAQRLHFITSMYDHMETAERLKKMEHIVFDQDQDMPFDEMGLCAKLAVMKRMEF